MLSISPSKKIVLFFGFIILFVEILVSIFPVYKFEKSETYLVHTTKLKIESGQNKYDMIILGDSTSMSLNPGPYKNIYNFSLPGMGVRYYPYFVKKYLKYQNKKPKAIIFSGTIFLVGSGKGIPLLPEEVRPFAKVDMSLYEYFKARFIDRPFDLFQPTKNQKERKFKTIEDEAEWILFSNRFLNLFSPLEIWEQFTGIERVFIFSHSLPLLYQTFKFREGIKNIFNYENYKNYENLYGEEFCSCENLFHHLCQIPESNYYDNLISLKFRENNNGYYNITDRMNYKLFSSYESQKQSLIEIQKKHSQLPPPIDFSYTKEFIEYLQKNNILYIYLAMPYPDYYREGSYHSEFFKHFENLLKNFPNTKIFYFPSKYLDRNLYIDQVHLKCEGARKLNEEFIQIVLPQIQEYVKLNYKE